VTDSHGDKRNAIVATLGQAGLTPALSTD